MSKFFGTDGFRGQAGSELTALHAFETGRFLGFRLGAGRGRKCRAAIGKDTRRSSYMLEYALAAGLAASGADAYMMHVATTPAVAYAVRAFGLDCGIAVSASHNAFADNGIKIFGESGAKLSDEDIALLEEYLAGGSGPLPQAVDGGVGAIHDFSAGRSSYAAYLTELAPRSLSGCSFGLDCANGAAYNLARRAFCALGAKVTAIGCRPDGVNINANCGSTAPARLCALVRARNLDAGFAFDGDGDRCIAVNERGEVVDGDGIMYILARHLLDCGADGGDRVVATVMSNSGLVQSLARLGVAVERCDVGDRFVAQKMRQCGAALGGEQSGHIIIDKVENTGDGIVTAIFLAQALVRSGGTFSRLTEGLDLWPQACASVPVRDKGRARSYAVLREISRAERAFGGRGRVLVRASGTENAVRIMAECPDGELCKNVCARIARAVAEG